MIAKLKGMIAQISQDSAIIDVHGVGYLVHCPRNVLANLCIGSTAELWIETEVKQDAIQLYGFHSLEEQRCFLMLQSVQGVGGKVALKILGTYAANQVVSFILQNNSASFQKISGIGSKLAARIVNELAPGLPKKLAECSNHIGNAPGRVVDDAISALVNLGFNRTKVTATVANLVQENIADEANLEHLLTLCLKQLSNLP